MKKQNLAIVKLVIALVVVYVVYRVVMASVDGFQSSTGTFWTDRQSMSSPNSQKDYAEDCGATSLKIIYSAPDGKTTKTACFKNRDANNKKLKYEGLNKVLPQKGVCMFVATPNTGAKIYKGDKVGQDNKADTVIGKGVTTSSNSCEVGSLVVYEQF